MPDLPALPLGQPETQARTTRRSPRPTLSGPGTAAQATRLAPALQRITEAFEAGRVSTSTEPAGAPEQVLVLEVAGELSEFAKAIEQIPGLEFLLEATQERIESGAEFAAVDSKGKVHRYDRQLYMLFSDQAAWTQMLSLWRRFQNGEKMPVKQAAFKHMFARLEDLRPWDDRDRLRRTGVLEAWEREVEPLQDELVQFEVELWLRADAGRREQALGSLSEDLAATGGRLISQFVLPEIGYHGVLAEVPAHLLRDVVARQEVRWLRTETVRFFHAVGQLAALPEPGEPEPAAQDVAQRPAPAAVEPRLAVFDGVPLAQHALLAGRIAVDDPDGWEGLVEASRRNHGTATASLVVHGDLNGSGDAQTAPVYVRPILTDQTPSWVTGGREELPRDRLAVDLIHEAVARLFESDAAVAPEVTAIVLALGDVACQFDRFVSPLARLLDWAQARYGVLVLVSAGNHPENLDLSEDARIDDPQALQEEVLGALAGRAGLRRLLSPAESINALTIGASHEDAASYRDDDGRIEPIVTPDLPNVVSANGAGVRRSVKPDLLLPGGRVLLTPEPHSPGDDRTFSVAATRRSPGARTAAPGRQAGVLDATTYATGTSVAAALAGHSAGHLLDELGELRAQYGERMPGPELDAVLVKAALIHSASWGSAPAFIESAIDEPDARRRREIVARTVGYGRAEPRSALVCDDYRATAIGGSHLSDGEAHVYRFPLPTALQATTEQRRLRLTLAWLSPINAMHRAYRRAALYVDRADIPREFVKRGDVDEYGARRGTVQHDVLTGRKAVPFDSGTQIELIVSCRADAGVLDVAVPYALIVTIEVAEGVELPIYEEVRQALRTPVAVRP